MSIRKFGSAEDQKVLADEKDTQGISKEASTFTDTDREQLQQEVQADAWNWGGSDLTPKAHN